MFVSSLPVPSHAYPLFHPFLSSPSSQLSEEKQRKGNSSSGDRSEKALFELSLHSPPSYPLSFSSFPSLSFTSKLVWTLNENNIRGGCQVYYARPTLRGWQNEESWQPDPVVRGNDCEGTRLYLVRGTFLFLRRACLPPSWALGCKETNYKTLPSRWIVRNGVSEKRKSRFLKKNLTVKKIVSVDGWLEWDKWGVLSGVATVNVLTKATTNIMKTDWKRKSHGKRLTLFVTKKKRGEWRISRM